MAVSAFSDVTWLPNSPVDTDTLNTMAANTRYLFERAPKLYYDAYGARKDAGVKIAAGYAIVPPSKANVQTVNVPFGTFFTPGCRPVITHGITSPVNGRIIASMYSLSGPTLVPNYQGFTARLAATELTAATNHFYKTLYLNWIAVGY